MNNQSTLKHLLAQAILTFILVMPLGFDTSAQTVSDSLVTVETEADTVSSPFIKQFFESGFSLPPEWQFIREDDVKYDLGNNKNKTTKMSTYKLPSGKFASSIIEDNNNYIWFWTPTATNQITGETEPIPQTSNQIIAFKRLIGDVGVEYDTTDGNSYYFYSNLDPDCEYAILSPRPGLLDFDTWGRIYYDKYLSKLYDTALGKTFQNASIVGSFRSKEDAEKFAEGWLMFINYDNKVLPFVPHAFDTPYGQAVIKFLHPTDPENTPISGDDEKYLMQVEPKMDHLNLKFYITTKNLYTAPQTIWLSTKDVVRSINKEGNVISIGFKQPGDYLKYSLYASNVYDGKLTRKNGYINLKNDYPKDGTFVRYFNNEPMQLAHYDPNYPSRKLGVIMVPAGLHSGEIDIEKSPSILCNYDTNNQIFFSSAGLETWFYDDADTHILTTYIPGAIFHKDGVRIAHQQDAALVKEEQAALAAIKAKYGASVVDNIMKGSIQVGMPWSVVKEAFPYNTMSNSKHSTTYRVMNNIPQIDRVNKKFIKVNVGLGQLVYVTVRGGKVDDVYYSGHN